MERLTYPSENAPTETWLKWVNEVAPVGGPCDPQLHPDLRYLTRISDREIAALAARGTVQTLRGRRLLDATVYEQESLW